MTDADEILEPLAEAAVVMVPGRIAHALGPRPPVACPFLRLSFGSASDEELRVRPCSWYLFYPALEQSHAVHPDTLGSWSSYSSRRIWTSRALAHHLQALALLHTAQAWHRAGVYVQSQQIAQQLPCGRAGGDEAAGGGASCLCCQ